MKKMHMWAGKALATAVALSTPIVGFCVDESVGQKSVRLTGEVNNITSLALTGAQFAGLITAGFGISNIMKDKDNPGQEMMKKGLFKVVGGVGLYFLPRILGMGQATLFP